MLIQFKDYDFLADNSHIEPTVNSDMLSYADRVIDIPDENVVISPEGWLKYAGWVWNFDWFHIITPMVLPATTAGIIHNIDYQNTDFVRALETIAMPDTLQYITIKHPSVVRDIVVDVNHYKVFFYKADNAHLFMKLSTTTEYNLTGYLGQRIDSLRPESTRVHEEQALAVAKGLRQAFRIAFDKKQQPHNVFLYEKGLTIVHNHSAVDTQNDFFHIELHRRGLDNDDFSYNSLRWAVGNLVCVAFTQSKYVDLSQASNLSNYNIIRQVGYELDELIGDDEFIITSSGSHIRMPIALKDELLPNIPLHTCPVFGIQSIDLKNFNATNDQVSPIALSLFHKTYGDSYDGILFPNYGGESEEDFYEFLDKIGDRMPSTYKNAERAVLHNGNWMSAAQRDSIEIRNTQFSKFNLKRLSENRYEYNGQTFYTDDEAIQEYDYEADIDFFGERDDLHLGVELEVDKGGEDHYNASIALGVLGWRHAYAMHDGSLNNGFEIATMPMTLEYHMSIEQRYRDAFGVLSALDYKSHNTSTCGMHIHFDRSFLGRSRQTQSIKAGYIALIMEKNWEKFVQFSRRSYDRIDQWAKKLDLVADVYADDTDEDVSVKFGNKYGYGDKYVALNTSHSHTYELRIFRGTLKPETYFATLQFVDNLVRIAKECPSLAKAQQITFADIINYNPHTHLVDYITSRGILTREYIEYRGE